MKKLIALTATALLATTLAATAAKVTFKLAAPTGTLTCTATLTVFSASPIVANKILVGLKENDATCGVLNGIGYTSTVNFGGSLGKLTGASIAVYSSLLVSYGVQYPLMFSFQTPFKTGNKYAITTTQDDKSITLVDAGTYTVP